MQRLTDDVDAMDFGVIKKSLEGAHNIQERDQLIVNSPFNFKLASALLFLGIIVLLKVDDDGVSISRISLSNTELAKNTTDVSVIPFNKIKIPMAHKENIISKAIQTQEPQDTTDWKFLFEPVLTAEEARLNQASGGIAYSAVYPLKGAGAGAALIFSYFQYMQNIGSAQREFMQQYSELVAEVLRFSPVKLQT